MAEWQKSFARSCLVGVLQLHVFAGRQSSCMCTQGDDRVAHVCWAIIDLHVFAARQ